MPVDSMPSWLRPVAEHQPVTPVIETVRARLLGTPIGNSGWLTLAWTIGLGAVAFAAAVVLFRRRMSD